MNELFNWGEETPEQRQARLQWEQELLLEQARKRFNVIAMTGGAGGGGGERLVSQYWIQSLFAPAGAESQIYLQSLAMDDEGNVYSLSGPNLDTAASLLIRKFTATGSLAWQYSVEATEYLSNINVEPSRIIIHQDRLYSLYSTIITKHTLNGDLIWQSSWNADSNEGPVFDFTGFVVDSYGDLIVTSVYNDATYIHRVESDTGQITKTVMVSIDVTPNRYFNAQPVIDSEGNIIVACNWLFSGYHSTIVKIDPTLSTVLRTFTMDDDAFEGDGDATSLVIDENDVIYVNQYGESVYALDSRTGSVVWTKQTIPENNAYHLAISDSGSIYWIGEIDWDEVNGADTRRIITVMKLDQDGNLEWTTGIRYIPRNIDFEVTGWDKEGTSGAQIFGENLLIAAELQIAGPDTETILKLPLTQVIGTYGDYEFFDITDVISLSSPEPVEIPVIALLTTEASPSPVEYIPSNFALKQNKIIYRI